MKIMKDVSMAVDLIVENIQQILEEKDYVIIGVPGGRSVKILFEVMKMDSRFLWHKIHIFMIDERLVPVTDEKSNYNLVKDQLLDEINIPKENLHPFILDETKNYGIQKYETELRKYGGIYDIIILGVGEDGHVGALYPNYTINNDSDYFIVIHDSPKLPKDRMTSSRKLLLRSKLAVVLFIGEGKRDAYENFINPDVSMNECPAKLVYDIKKTIVLTGE